jgi:hypothetical protein
VVLGCTVMIGTMMTTPDYASAGAAARTPHTARATLHGAAGY